RSAVTGGEPDPVVTSVRGNGAVVIQAVHSYGGSALHFTAIPQTVDLLVAGKRPSQRPISDVHSSGVLNRDGCLKASVPLIHDAVDDVACECPAGGIGHGRSLT